MQFQILGTPCASFLSELEVKHWLESQVQRSLGGYSVAINAEKLVRARDDAPLRGVISSAALAVPDGFMAVVGLRWIHGVRSIKVDLPRCALESADENAWRVAVCGASESVNASAAEEIRRRYPRIRIVLTMDGYQQDVTIRNAIVAVQPDLVLLALGSPKQELLAQAWTALLPNTFIVGCGGALDILSGRVKRAPKFMIDNGLEWAFRLWLDPKRWRRQLVLPVCLWRIGAEAIRSRFARL